jgi:hypothetical protein
LLLWAGAALAVFALHRGVGLAVDDGFIVLRYVDHLLAGNGLVYNPGERVEGFSSPLWVALVAAGEATLRIVLPPSTPRLELLQRGLGLGFAGLAVLATAQFAHRRLALPRATSWGAAAALLLSWPFVFWSGAGLETPLFALLIVAVALQLGGPAPFEGRGAWAALALLTALAWTRPEGPLFTFLAGAGAVHVARDRTRALTVLTAVFGLHALLVAARWNYYGELLPNTYYAKVGGGALAALRGGAYLFDYYTRGGGGGLVALALWGAISRVRCPGAADKPRGAGGVPGALLLAGVGFVLLVGGDGLYCFRFVVPFLPLICAFAALGSSNIGHRLRRHAPTLAPGMGWALFAGAVLLGARPLLGDEALLAGVRNHRTRASEAAWLELGDVLKENVPRNELLATNVAGKVPYASGLPAIDMLGLTDAVIARTSTPTMGRGYAGHEKANVSYVLERRPGVIFISVLERLPLDAAEEPAQLRASLARSVLGSYAALFELPAFLEAYRPASAETLALGSVPLFVRRDLAPRLGPEIAVREWSLLGEPGTLRAASPGGDVAGSRSH